MGWNSTIKQINRLKLNFQKLDDAINWCNKNKLKFIVIDQSFSKSIKPKSYASNFPNKGRISWTH